MVFDCNSPIDLTFYSQSSHLVNILLKLLVTLLERRSLLNDWEWDIEEEVGDDGDSIAAGSDEVGRDDVEDVFGHETITIGDTQTCKYTSI